MPFTLFLARLIGMLLIVGFVGILLNTPGLSELAGTAAVWLALIGVPVFIAEAFGFLRSAARFFFGAAQR